MKKYDIAVLDFETMNSNTDSPCEVGISLIKDLKVQSVYSSYINPPNNFFSSKNAEIHKISKNTISEAPPFEKVYPEIKSIIQNVHIVIAHNAHFDVSVLKSTIKRCNLEQLNYAYLDSINIFKQFLGNTSVSMDSLCDIYGINKENLHSAKYDVQALSSILLTLATNNDFNNILELIQNMKKQYIKFSQLTKVQNSINNFSFHKNSIKVSDINKIPIENENEQLNNKNIVFTGDFETLKTDLMIIARKNGANIKSTVSSKTDILVEGIQDKKYIDANGLVSKQRDARKYISAGIPIQLLNESSLLNIIEGELL